jgi:hypothetical protein
MTRILTHSTVNRDQSVYNLCGGVSCLTRGRALGRKPSRAREGALPDETSRAWGRVKRIARGYNRNIGMSAVAGGRST